VRNELLGLFENGPIVINKFELLFQCRANMQLEEQSLLVFQSLNIV
jgi:hypothetical protein